MELRVDLFARIRRDARVEGVVRSSAGRPARRPPKDRPVGP